MKTERKEITKYRPNDPLTYWQSFLKSWQLPIFKQILPWPATTGVMTEWIWVLLPITENPEARQPQCLCSRFSSFTIGKSRYLYLKLWQSPFPFTRSATSDCPTAESPPLDKSNAHYNIQFGLKPICSTIIPYMLVSKVISSQIHMSVNFAPQNTVAFHINTFNVFNLQVYLTIM